jgi:citrate lyase subunit beta / citryl-CoA lyase
MISSIANRSYLFAPGHNAKLLHKVFLAGADAVILDLEDAVPGDAKDRAREMVVEAIRHHRALVRVNPPRSREIAADIDAVAPYAAAIRIPKCESAEDVAWVAARAPGVPLVPAIETARGVLAAQEIALAPAVAHMSIGGLDLLRDLYAGTGNLPMLYVRSHLVVVSSAAGLPPPVDSVYPLIDDDAGLREQAQFARSLGFAAKSAIHPRQIPILHEVFAPSAQDLEWAHAVLTAFEAAGRGATRLPSGEFVDLPVAQRAQRLLEIAGRTAAERDGRAAAVHVEHAAAERDGRVVSRTSDA